MLEKEKKYRQLDLRGQDLRNLRISRSSFENITFDGAVMDGSCMRNAFFKNCTFLKTSLKKTDMEGAEFVGCDLTGADIRGANLYCAVLEYAVLDEVIADHTTSYYEMRCPAKGAFLGYKKCFNDRLVQLLIPADAKRSSATNDACRCSKAKVLTIKSFDYTESFDEAWSLVDENFVYRAGETVAVEDYHENRWKDSTTGIHFWMTREQAKAY